MVAVTAVTLTEEYRVQFRAPLASLSAKPRGSFGTHFREKVKVGPFDVQTGSLQHDHANNDINVHQI